MSKGSKGHKQRYSEEPSREARFGERTEQWTGKGVRFVTELRSWRLGSGQDPLCLCICLSGALVSKHACASMCVPCYPQVLKHI